MRCNDDEQKLSRVMLCYRSCTIYLWDTREDDVVRRLEPRCNWIIRFFIYKLWGFQPRSARIQNSSVVCPKGMFVHNKMLFVAPRPAHEQVTRLIRIWILVRIFSRVQPSRRSMSAGRLWFYLRRKIFKWRILFFWPPLKDTELSVETSKYVSFNNVMCCNLSLACSCRKKRGK